MDFLKVLEGVQLSEEQVAALDKCLTDWQEKKTEEIKKALLEEVSDAPEVDLSKYVLIEDSEKAFAKFQEDADKAFGLYEENCESAFELFEEHCTQAFNMGMEDLQSEYTENMTQALAEVYPEMQERVKKDFLESDEYKAVQKMKEIIIPLLSDDVDVAAKLKALTEDNVAKDKANKELAKTNTINTLLKDIPKEFEEEVRTFISAGEDEEDVIERFNAILEIVEKKIVGEKVPVPVTEEKSSTFKRKRIAAKSEPKPVDNTEKPITEEKIPDVGNPTVGYDTIIAQAKKDESDIRPFTEQQISLIDRMFIKKK